MTATADETRVLRPRETALARAEGIELLGDLHGSGYERGAALARRADGQVVQLGPLMYALLECIDGRRTTEELSEAMCEKLGRACDEETVVALAQKLAAQGLLAGHEHKAPPRRNALLALRWKVLITNPKWTSRLTAPFTFLYRPFIVVPVVAAFLIVCWFVLFHKGVASATSDAIRKPELLVLVFVLAIASAAFHEIGHGAACRYGGATPGGMGAGLYLVWPAFYTDVTDAYRLPKRDRLRVDLGGLYFNAVVSVITLGLWLVWRHDALLLLIAIQLLMMVKNMSPVIRSDGYHILADWTGVPDLYSHIKPTLVRLLPWRRHEPSALTGRARLIVTLWVLIVVPVLISLMLGAVLVLPRLITTAWDSGHAQIAAIPHEGWTGVAASLLRIVALTLPAVASLLVGAGLVRMYVQRGRAWSAGRPIRRTAVVLVGALIACGAAWAWWPSGQYEAVQPSDHGTLLNLGRIVAQPVSYVRPAPQRLVLAPGKHLAMAMIPVGGATKAHPAYYFIAGKDGQPAIGLISDGSRYAAAFPFKLPSAPGPGGNQAMAVNTKSGSVLYRVAYMLVTVQNGDPVTNTNAAYALAHCTACTTVAVAFQVVLVVGSSKSIAPINAAVAFNNSCPACLTTAIADQIVVTLNSQPSQELLNKLTAALQQLGAITALGLRSPADIANVVAQVQQQVDTALQDSGLVPTTTTTTAKAATQSATTAPPTATAAPQTTAAETTTAQTTTTAKAQTTSTTATTTAATTTAATTTGTTTTTP